VAGCPAPLLRKLCFAHNYLLPRTARLGFLKTLAVKVVHLDLNEIMHDHFRTILFRQTGETWLCPAGVQGRTPAYRQQMS
jgi:hypothetical protein